LLVRGQLSKDEIGQLLTGISQMDLLV